MYQKGTRGTVLFVPFKRQGKYNPSLARFCILIALLVLSCTMSHLKMLVSDDGWKVAPVGGAAMSRALSQVGLGPEGIPCHLIQVVYPTLKYAVRIGIPYFLTKFSEISEYITKILKWVYEKIDNLPKPMQQSIQRNLEMPGRELAQKSENCYHYETVFEKSCNPDGTPFYEIDTNYCQETKKEKDENCAYTVKQTLQNTMDILQSEDNTVDATSLSLAIFAVLGILYSYYCINSGSTPVPAPGPAQNAPVPAPAPTADDNFPTVTRGGSTTDLTPFVKNSVKNGLYDKRGLLAILQQDNPNPGVNLRGLRTDALVELIRKWYDF